MDDPIRNSPMLEPLKQAPLINRGFNDSLRERIMRELDAGRSPSRKMRIVPGLALALAGFAAIFAVLLFRPDADPEVPEIARKTTQGSVAILQAEPVTRHEWRDGLLIGLAADRIQPDGGQDSAYRTLWIAPEGESIALMAEGEGVLVPYGLDFWFVGERDTESETVLFARKITQKRALPAGDPLLMDDARADADNGPTAIRERLLFAGQSHVVLARTDEDGTEIMLSSLQQLETGERQPLPIRDILEEPPAEVGDWAIVREHGRWTASTPEGDYPLGRQASVHDGLCISWQAITKAVPGATDAFCSPGANWMAVVTDGALLALPIGGDGEPGEPALRIPLYDNEQPVMAEWATGIYVPKWSTFISALYPDGGL